MAGSLTLVNPAVFVSKPSKDEVRLRVDMRSTNEAIQGDKLPIPTVDDVLEEMMEEHFSPR